MQTVLDEYDIVTQVPAPGGMGLVYGARRTSGEVIALKVIPLGRTSDSEAAVRSERRGAEVQKLLGQHDPHVPKVYDFGEKHGVFFIEMEFIPGEDLSALIARQGPLPPRDAARIAYEVASFLDVAHHTTYGDHGDVRAELVHSDLKPSNIRIARVTNEIKIIDFGIARAGWHTATTNQFGSLPYMSPERIEGRIDRHVDYWALGVVLYEMLAGKLPFSGPGGPSHPQHVQHLILRRRPPPPLPPAVPASLQAIVATLLRGDQAGRYQDAAAVKADLAAFLSGGTPKALRGFMQPHAAAHEGDTIVVNPIGPPRSAATATIAVDRPVRRRSRRSFAVRAVYAVCALVALGQGAEACAVRRESAALAQELRTASSVDPDTAWTRYEGIRRRGMASFLMRDAGTAVKRTLVAAADRVLADFRTDRPTVRKSDWQVARAWLERAASLDRSDRSTRARLASAEAHLLRIAGDEKQDSDLLRQAVQRFEEAARLDRAAPDPYLGLARIYSAGLIDFDRASEALAGAERRGHPIGRRGHAQLGDAIKARGDRWRQSAFSVRGLPEERAYLVSAVEDYEQALAFYEKAPGFGLVSNNVRLVRRRLEQIGGRLADIDVDGLFDGRDSQ